MGFETPKTEEGTAEASQVENVEKAPVYHETMAEWTLPEFNDLLERVKTGGEKFAGDVASSGKLSEEMAQASGLSYDRKELARFAREILDSKDDSAEAKRKLELIQSRMGEIDQNPILQDILPERAKREQRMRETKEKASELIQSMPALESKFEGVPNSILSIKENGRQFEVSAPYRGVDQGSLDELQKFLNDCVDFTITVDVAIPDKAKLMRPGDRRFSYYQFAGALLEYYKGGDEFRVFPRALFKKLREALASTDVVYDTTIDRNYR